MTSQSVQQLFPLLASGLGLALLVWGFVLNLSGHESAQSWSLIGVGVATLGSVGVAWRRRGSGQREPW